MIDARQPINTLEDLHEHLQLAIGLELSTIPAYLCALYSIRPGANSAACEVIQSVVLEEMLHMALAANVLNAIGGVPSTAPVAGNLSPVPAYPATLPYIDGIPPIKLQTLSPKAVEEFIKIEHPAEPGTSASGKRYASIGAFYQAIKDGLRGDLCTPQVFAKARRDRGDCQMRAIDYYGGAGTLVDVTDLDSARKALEEIVAEGEGLPPSALDQTAHDHLLTGTQIPEQGAPAGLSPHDVDAAGRPVVDGDQLPYGWKMYSHYARFREIQFGRRYRRDQHVKDEPAGDILPIDWDAVRPMVANPCANNYVRTYAHEPMMACDRTYTALVDATYCAFNGNPDHLGDAVRLMYELKYQAEALFNMPSPLANERGQSLGPAFEYLNGQDNPRAAPALGSALAGGDPGDLLSQ